MSTPEDLKDLYIDELKDMWSANDQMQRVLKKFVPMASDEKLKGMLTRSLEGIGKHTTIVKQLLAAAGEKTSTEHCRGMQGLVAKRRSM